jgi:hypothetical protein
MRLALAALTLSGCLYVGEVNSAPHASLVIDDPPATLIKGAPLQLHGSMSDPEDGTHLSWEWKVAATDGAALDPTCDFIKIEPGAISAGQPTATFTFFRTGGFAISFTAYDHLHARSQIETVMVTVADAPPVFGLSTNQLSARIARDPSCNTYVAGQPIPLVLDGRMMGSGSAVTVSDDDAQPNVPIGCDLTRYEETITYRWKIVGLPADSHAVIGPKPSQDAAHPSGDAGCPTTPPAGLTAEYVPGEMDFPGAACFYPDVGGATIPRMYQIALFVSDGNTEIRTDVYEAPVRADLPPCLTGASPTPGAYVIDRAELQHFLVTGVADDLDPFPSPQLGFVWSIWRERDPTWRAVPSWSLPSFDLDPSQFSVGEKLRVRVEPLDRTQQRAGCSADADTCTVDSCLVPPGQTCQQWATWDLELR